MIKTLALVAVPIAISQTTWGRTKISVFFTKVVLPYVLEPLLIYWFRYFGPRTVLKHWKAQLERHQPSIDGVSKRSVAASSSSSLSFHIELATLRKHRAHVETINAMVNGSYVRELRDALVGGGEEAEATFKRTSPLDVERRLLSDAELDGLRKGESMISRVLFLAIAEDDGAIVGTCSATLAAPWTGEGVGSWGLLAVSTPRGGVGRRLVEHCESYLRLAMLKSAEIEYFCIAGHPSSERLREWYETRLGYTCFKARENGHSYRGNEVKGQVFFRHARKPLDIADDLQAELNAARAAGRSEDEIFATRKRRIADFLLGKGKDH